MNVPSRVQGHAHCLSPHFPGFTLVELLVVVALSVMLIALSVPTLSMLTASNFTMAVNEVQGVLDVARNNAIAQNTYIWVGFKPVGEDVAVVTVASINGENDLTHSNLRLLIKPSIKSHLRVNASPDIASGESSLASGNLTFEQRIPVIASGPTSFSPVIAFNPRGEAFVQENTTSNWICFDLQKTSAHSPSVASFRINGVNGRISVNRNDAAQP